MAPKSPTQEPDASSPDAKKPKIDPALKKNTASANAVASGAEAIVRSDTPRKERISCGLVAVHWNVGGMNSLLSKDDKRALLSTLVETESPDILCFSEHKFSTAKLDAGAKALLELVPGYKAHWAVCTAKNGYSGVVALVKDGLELAAAPQIDTVGWLTQGGKTAVARVTVDGGHFFAQVGSLNEGRTLTLELADVFVVVAYVPNSGMKLERLDYRIGTWEPAMRAHLKTLGASKPVALIGDLNVAHLDADIWNVEAKHIPKSAGCTPRERAAFGELLAEGHADAFRTLHPEASGCFSYWSTRSGNQLLNRGLRLDYAVLSNALLPGGGAPLELHDCAMMKEYAPNGDHGPTLVALRRK